MKFAHFIWMFILPFFSLFPSSLPIEIDYAIFLFDNGEKNLIASMLKYAETHDKTIIRELDFRIIFMGASIDAISQEPFCHYPDKLIHYKQLGLEETIDRNWIRDRKISPKSLENLCGNLHIKKKSMGGGILLCFWTDFGKAAR